MTGSDDLLTNHPTWGFHHKIADVAKPPVTCHGFRAPQIRIGTFGLRGTLSDSLGKGFAGSSKIGKPLILHNASLCQ
jgi:hypothetical protein